MVSCNLCSSTTSRPVFRAKGFDLVRCGQCDLAYVANPPDAEQLRRLYSADASDYHTELHNPNPRPRAAWRRSPRGT